MTQVAQVLAPDACAVHRYRFDRLFHREPRVFANGENRQNDRAILRGVEEDMSRESVGCAQTSSGRQMFRP